MKAILILLRFSQVCQDFFCKLTRSLIKFFLSYFQVGSSEFILTLSYVCPKIFSANWAQELSHEMMGNRI